MSKSESIARKNETMFHATSLAVASIVKLDLIFCPTSFATKK